MNSDSSEASSQRPSETAGDAQSKEPTSPTPARDQQAAPEAATDASDGVTVEPTVEPSESVSESGGETTQSPETTTPEQTPMPPRGVRRPKIQIGSRRHRSEEGPGPSQPQIAGAQTPVETAPVEATPKLPASGPVPVPSVRDPLSPDLEEQFAAALDDAALEEMLTGPDAPASGASVELESRRQAKVVRIHGDNVFFTLGGRNEGVVSLRQFTEPPALGVELEVVVKSFLTDEGLYELMIPGASAHVEDWSDLVEGTIVDARITGANTGGLECKVGSLRGFIPSSQIAMFRVEDYADFIDQKLPCVVTEVNPKRKNLVLSRRAVLEREKEETRQQLVASLETGQVKEGVVRKLMDFGAFVDIGGVDGLVHISQLSWDRVGHPREVLEVGQTIRVKIEKVDPQTGKIGLSYRDLLDHPWTDIEERFPVDSVVTGTVSRVAKFGAFVRLSPGVEGLVHISELSHGRVPNVGAAVSEGQQVEVKVLSVDSDAQRIALSMRAMLPEPEAQADKQDDASDAAQSEREKLAAKRTKPLKGGTGGDSGGEKFGLKW